MLNAMEENGVGTLI